MSKYSIFSLKCVVHWESEYWTIQIKKHLKTGLFSVQLSNGLTIRKVDKMSVIGMVRKKVTIVLKNIHILDILAGFWQNSCHFVPQKQKKIIIDICAFKNQTEVNHSNSRLVRYLDPHCIVNLVVNAYC